MSLHKLALELDETARQTTELAEGVMQALAILSDQAVPDRNARDAAARMIVAALQGQDRIQQRCSELAAAARQFARLPPNAPDSAHHAIWTNLLLDELRVDDRVSPRRTEIELF